MRRRRDNNAEGLEEVVPEEAKLGKRAQVVIPIFEGTDQEKEDLRQKKTTLCLVM